MTNLNFYLDRFRLECQAGNDARLLFDCHAGQVWVSLHVHGALQPPQQQHRRHHGPSRLRRRARRAEARASAAAAAKAVTVTAEIAVQTDNVFTEHCDDIPSLPIAAADAALQHPRSDEISAEQAEPLPALSHVADVFCPDPVYEPAVQAGGGQRYAVPCLPHQNIPQLDGMEYPDLSLMISRREKEVEERRKDREKDLKNIEMMIKKNFQF